MSVCRVVTDCSGLTAFTFPEPPFRLQRLMLSRPNGSNMLRFVPENISGLGLRRSVSYSTNIKRSAYSGRNHRELRFEEDGFNSEPFWVGLAREAFGGLRSVVLFLVEQPGQLKYIEWTTFQSTLKTASLTLVLVAMLIVALFSVDATLAYLFALLLRKSA